MPRPSKELVDPRLAEDIKISRREIAEGKGIPHAQVMHEMDDLIAAVDKIEEYKDILIAEGEADCGEKISIEEFEKRICERRIKEDLCAKSQHCLLNAETIAALEEGDRRAAASTVSKNKCRFIACAAS